MTMKSILWTTGTTGDGATPYTQDELLAMFKAIAKKPSGGVFSIGSMLEVVGTSHPTSPHVDVANGSATLKGFFCTDPSSIQLDLVLPVVGTTGFRVVLQGLGGVDRTVRQALLQATDGTATPPAVTQDAGFPASGTWEISLAYGTVTTGGDVSVTDDRNFVHPLVSYRKGGDPTTWETAGTTFYIPSDTRVEVGVASVTIPAGDASAFFLGDFYEAFAGAPLLLATAQGTAFGAYYPASIIVSSITTQFRIVIAQNAVDSGAPHSYSISWLAMGKRA